MDSNNSLDEVQQAVAQLLQRTVASKARLANLPPKLQVDPERLSILATQLDQLAHRVKGSHEQLGITLSKHSLLLGDRENKLLVREFNEVHLPDLLRLSNGLTQASKYLAQVGHTILKMQQPAEADVLPLSSSVITALELSSDLDASEFLTAQSALLTAIADEIGSIIAEIHDSALIGSPSQPFDEVLRITVLMDARLLAKRAQELSYMMVGIPRKVSSVLPTDSFNSQYLALSHMFDALLPYLSDNLVKPSSQDRIRRFLSAISYELTSIIGFEARLSQKDDQVDISLYLDHTDGNGADILAGSKLPNLQMPLDTAEWKAVGNLCRAWTDPNSLLHNTIKAMWLEFDLPEKSNQPQPMPFIRLEDTLTEDPLSVVLEAYSALLDEIELHSIESALRRHVQEMHSGQLRWIALMRQRGTSGITFVVVPGQSGPLDLMEQLNWLYGLTDHEQAFLRNIISDLNTTYLPLFDRIAVNIGFENGRVRYPIGIECSYEAGRQIENEPRWQIVFDKLVEASLCTREKANALTAWSGYGSLFTSDSAPPQNLLRRLNHIKFKFGPSSPLEAKAYFYAMHKARR